MKKMTLGAAVLLAAFFLAGPAFAECGGKQCPMSGSGCGKMDCGKMSSEKGGEEYQCPIVGKFMKKAHFFLENQKEIGLSEEQVKTIKGLKMEVKKGYIRQMAEMQIFEMDLETKMSEPVVDVQGINAMIDSGMAGMASGAKATVDSYAKLKAVLSETQMAKAKEIWAAKQDSREEAHKH